jgi:hypothetical protein
MISTFTAIIDANVFYGARLRSLILFLAQTGLFRARWSDDIHAEWMSNLLAKRPDIARADLEILRDQMNSAVLDCLVCDYKPLIASLRLPDEKDRHVLAAAIRGHANVIVSFNLKHFPDDILNGYGLHARHPDDFLLDLFGLDEEGSMAAVQTDIAHYKEPPLTVEDYLNSLTKAGVPKTAEYLRERKIIFE